MVNKKTEEQKESINNIRDIFNGDVIQVWEDDEIVTIAFPLSAVSFPKEIWPDIKKDLEKLAEL